MPPIELKTFATAAEMRAHYAAVRARFAAHRPPSSKPPPVKAPPPPKAEAPLPILPQPVLTPSRRILIAVSRKFDVSVDDLCSPRRTDRIVEARNVAVYLIRSLTGLSLPRIGERVGDRDHSTISHALHNIEWRLATEPEFAAKIDALQHQLLGEEP